MALSAIIALYLIVYFWVRTDFGGIDAWLDQFVSYLPWVAGHLVAVLIISLYNGKLGYHERWFARLYTAFYPLHLLVLGIICTFRQTYRIPQHPPRHPSWYANCRI